MKSKYIYVASSWRNQYQSDIVALLREKGFEVYDFKNPAPGESGFHWSEIDQNWKEWQPAEFISSLLHPIAVKGFGRDWAAMQNADTCVLVLPCGRSAHLEAGYFIGANKKTIIYIPDPCEPELMYNMAGDVVCNTIDLLALLGE